MDNQTSNFAPFTKNKIISVLLDDLKSRFPSYHPAAMYLSGSRLNRLNTIDSDFDVYIFVQSQKEDILNNVIMTKNFKVHFSEKDIDNYLHKSSIDVTVFDQRQLFKLLKKSNPGMLELLAEKPFWFDMNYGQLYAILSEKNNQHYLREINPSAFVSAVGGMLRSEQKQLALEKKRSLKDISTMAKLLYYLKCITNNKDISTNMTTISDTKPRKLRHLFDTDQLSFSDALVQLKCLENEYVSLKEKFENDNESKFAKQKTAEAYLEKNFIYSLLNVDVTLG